MKEIFFMNLQACANALEDITFAGERLLNPLSFSLWPHRNTGRRFDHVKQMLMRTLASPRGLPMRWAQIACRTIPSFSGIRDKALTVFSQCVEALRQPLGLTGYESAGQSL